MERKRNLLEPGWGYFQINRVDTLTKEGQPLTSKKGSPMMKISLQVTDSGGATEFVTDWITAEMDWKMANIEEALGLNKACLYDKATGRFNTDILRNKCGASSIDVQSSDQYGDSVRIKMYVPLDFMRMVHREEKAVTAPVAAPSVSPISSPHPASVWTTDDMDIPF